MLEFVILFEELPGALPSAFQTHFPAATAAIPNTIIPVRLSLINWSGVIQIQVTYPSKKLVYSWIQ